MQSRASNLSFHFIPCTYDQHYIKDHGKIFLTATHEQVEPDSEGYVTIKTIIGPRRIKQILAIALTFKKSRVAPHLWDNLETGFIKEDGDLLDPSNMVILFPDGGLEHPAKPGYCYIPAFTRYVVTKAGEIFDTEKQKQVRIDTYTAYESTTSMAGYCFATVMTDLGQRTSLGLHRALCLAYKRFPVNVDILDVNHENGIKGDNELGNLTWATRRRNNLHAAEMGNRTDNHPIIVKSIYSGLERTYFSLTECARTLNVHAELIRYRADKDGQRAYKPGLLFKRASSKTPWLAVTHPDSLLGSGTSCDYDCLDTATGSTERFRSGTALQKFLKIDGKEFASRHNTNDLNFGRYVVSKVEHRESCESLFAEKQKSYLL